MTTREILQRLQPLLDTRRTIALDEAEVALREPSVSHESLNKVAKQLGYAAGYSACASYVIRWLIQQVEREYQTPPTPTNETNPRM